MPTVAAIIIGDEILTGKVVDVNTPRLIAACRARGSRLARIAVVGDDPAAIADEVGRAAAGHDLVITSGGVGPTHDDRTVEGVALAFGLATIRHPDIEAMIRGWWGDRVNDAALRMADVPEGARLMFGNDAMLPIVVCRNVHLLPGVPRLFERKLAVLEPILAGDPVVLASLYLDADESDIAAVLADVDRQAPGVAIGSYPRPRGLDHRVWVTVEGPDRTTVLTTVETLADRLPDGSVVRIDRG